MKKIILTLTLLVFGLIAQAQTKAEFDRFRSSFPMLPNGYTPNIEQIASNEPLNQDKWFSANHGVASSSTYYPVGVVCEGKKFITFMYMIFTKYGDEGHFDFELIKSTYEGYKKFLYNDQLRIAKTDNVFHQTFKLKRKKEEYEFTVYITSKVNDYEGKKKITGTCD